MTRSDACLGEEGLAESFDIRGSAGASPSRKFSNTILQKLPTLSHPQLFGPTLDIRAVDHFPPNF